MVQHDFVIYTYDKGLNKKQFDEDKKELQKIHLLRARFIHYMSFLEFLMKENCDIINSKAVLKKVLPKFETFLLNQNIPKNEIKSFVANIKKLNEQRDKWAHAIVYFNKRRNLKIPNGFIGKSPLNKYFDKINDRFKIIFNFLQNHNFLKLKNKYISAYIILNNYNALTS